MAIKIHYVIEEEDAHGPLYSIMDALKEGDTIQYKRSQEAYKVWGKKNTIACVVNPSAMDDYVAKKLYGYEYAHDLLVVSFEVSAKKEVTL